MRLITWGLHRSASRLSYGKIMAESDGNSLAKDINAEKQIIKEE